MAKVTIFGWVGSGKTSVGKELAKRLGYEFISTVNMFREEAVRLNLSLHDYEKLCNEDPEQDKTLDNKITKYAKTHDNFIIDSRLAWYFVPDSIKIKLVGSDEKRIKRVAERENISLHNAKYDIDFRESAGKKRYLNLYGITEIAPDKLFDFIIDTTNLQFEEVVAEVEKFLQSKI